MNLTRGEFSVVEGGRGGDCIHCNRLRLTANGYLKPCLFNDKAFNVRELGVEEAFRKALEDKPKSGTTNSTCTFYGLGG
jgi:cyclic pyranopterin phosphate synthase